MGAVLMYNFEKDNLKDLGVKSVQKDFNALKFKSAFILMVPMTNIQKTQIIRIKYMIKASIIQKTTNT